MIDRGRLGTNWLEIHSRDLDCAPSQMKMSGDMFEGKDYPTQWALNPSAYQNMSNDQGEPSLRVAIL